MTWAAIAFLYVSGAVATYAAVEDEFKSRPFDFLLLSIWPLLSWAALASAISERRK